MARPTLQATPAATREGEEAVRRLVAELEQGLNSPETSSDTSSETASDPAHADLTDRRLAENVMWGSPFGATVAGYAPLHAIHERFRAKGVAHGSHYEVERIVVPVPGVALAHVRRVAPAPSAPAKTDGGLPNAAAFSQMALYVLVRHGDDWWVAAGQNTPIRPAQP
jgi:hypothetical protein